MLLLRLNITIIRMRMLALMFNLMYMQTVNANAHGKAYVPDKVHKRVDGHDRLQN